MILSEFLKLFKQGKVSAHSHMKNLLEMAMADGHYDEAEDRFLSELASKHNVSKSTLKAIKNHKIEVDFMVPSSFDDKFLYLYELIHMMVIDNHVDHSELRLCGIFAKKFGFDPTKIDELVESIAANIKNGNSLQETQKRVNWLLN